MSAFKDLGKLARQRTRESVGTVLQLLEEDNEKAALLVSVAYDFIEGAAYLIADDETSEDEALGGILMMIMSAIGPERVALALKLAREKREEG